MNMKRLLSEVRSTEPKREYGDISDVKRSIAAAGLINPLTVDQEGNFLAGRQRYQAICGSGWYEGDT